MGEIHKSTDVVDHDELPSSPLDLSRLPLVYLLTTHLPEKVQDEAEDALHDAGAPLTYDIKEASLVLGNISMAKRAKKELQWKGVRVEDVGVKQDCQSSESSSSSSSSASKEPNSSRKRRRLAGRGGKWRAADITAADSTTASETEDELDSNVKVSSQNSLSQTSTPSTLRSSDTIEVKDIPPPLFDLESFLGKVKVVKLEWLNDSLRAKQVLNIEQYTVYEAKLLLPVATLPKPPQANSLISAAAAVLPLGKDVCQAISTRVNANSKSNNTKFKKTGRFGDGARPDIEGKSVSSSTQARKQRSNQPITRPSQLLRQTTSEHEEAINISLPSMPDWVLQNKIYACERATPLNSPNKDFICQLKKIKLARLLTLDEIGVRAYSSSIASIAAYPHPLETTREVLALPGCDQKIARLFHEWQSTNGHIGVVADIEADQELSVLREFYEIWGVGPKTAKEFYDKGWRDLDDIVDFGWKSTSRVQQIGVKYYEELLLKIPRAEVEAITAIITQHAKLVTDTNVETIIVGGYRRGKPESGDVDVILSHRDEAMTHNLIDRVVKSLEIGGWIPHTLSLNLTNTKRNQEPLPINTATQVGHGFDTLDKALVVWQDPNWPTKTKDLAADPKAKNPNLHRRVDIIISPWRTVGCAVAGWTSGTTFQRDLRRYAKHVKGWKFDSSGVRERGTGRWVDLEGWRDPNTRCQDWRQAERKVFEGMGLVYREPWDRCTG